MLVFWWTGKGYLAPIIVLSTMIVFGFILKAGGSFLNDGQAFWGVAFAVAGIVNWFVGCRQNAKKLAAIRSTKLHHRLFYRARNKFMSLPFEVWSIPLVVGGLMASVSALFEQ